MSTDEEGGESVSRCGFTLIEEALGPASLTGERQNVAGVLLDEVDTADICAHLHGVPAHDFGTLPKRL